MTRASECVRIALLAEVPEAIGVLAQKGIGTALIEAAERKAGRLRIPSLYAGTESAVSLFSRRGWNPVDRVAESGEQLTIFRSEPYNNSVA